MSPTGGQSIGRLDRIARSAALTPKQARFVEEYLFDLNATQAAIRAGCSPSTARVIAGQNLSRPNVADAIAAVRPK